MDVARLNLSHGEYAGARAGLPGGARGSDETGQAVGILVDLQGPKIRLGNFIDGEAFLEPGARFVITTDDVPGDQDRVCTTFTGHARRRLAPATCC